MKIDYRKIGRRIRDARKEKGLTQEQLAELVNLSTDHVSHIEIGSASLSLAALLAFCETLGVSADQLLYDNLPQVAPASEDKQIERYFSGTTACERKLMLAMAIAARDALRE